MKPFGWFDFQQRSMGDKLIHAISLAWAKTKIGINDRLGLHHESIMPFESDPADTRPIRFSGVTCVEPRINALKR